MVASRRGGVINVSSIAGLLGEVGGPCTRDEDLPRSVHEEPPSELQGTGSKGQALCGLVGPEFHDQQGVPMACATQGIPVGSGCVRWTWYQVARCPRPGQGGSGPGLRYRLLLAMVNNPIGRALADRYTDRLVQR